MSTSEANDRGTALMTGAAWRAFCERLATVGEQLLEPGLPDSPRDRAEGYRHLMNQVACWMTYAVGSNDALNPLLFRHNDLVYRWGGPNIDQNSRRTVISGRHTYRVSGSMGSAEEFALQVKRGEMHTGDAGVDATLWASELGLGPGDAFSVTLSSDPADEPTMLISANASLLHIRDYYYQWASAEPAEFVLERTDQTGELPAPLTPERVADLLDIAATQVESSIRYWIDYQENLRVETPLNEFGPPALVAEGVAGMYYAHCFIRLAPDEALVIDVRPDEAAHWNLQLYNRAWYESLDFANRITHTNEALVTTAADGTAQIVVSATDPGTANWIDTEGRDEVMATSRWTRPPDVPHISSRVVNLLDLPDVGLPPIVASDDRQAQIARRRAHVAWRYHT